MTAIRNKIQPSPTIFATESLWEEPSAEPSGSRPSRVECYNTINKEINSLENDPRLTIFRGVDKAAEYNPLFVP